MEIKALGANWGSPFTSVTSRFSFEGGNLVGHESGGEQHEMDPTIHECREMIVGEVIKPLE
jgi:hypothetical protein